MKENGLEPVERGGLAGAHEVERAVAGLRDGRSHAGLEGGGAGGGGTAGALDVDLGGEGGAVDEGFALGAGEKGVGTGGRVGKDGELGGVVGDDGEDDVGGGGYLGEGGGVVRAQFGGEGGGGGSVDVVDGGDDVAVVELETPGHVGAHATDSDEGDGFRHGGWRVGGGARASSRPTKADEG